MTAQSRRRAQGGARERELLRYLIALRGREPRGAVLGDQQLAQAHAGGLAGRVAQDARDGEGAVGDLALERGAPAERGWPAPAR